MVLLTRGVTRMNIYFMERCWMIRTSEIHAVDRTELVLKKGKKWETMSYKD